MIDTTTIDRQTDRQAYTTTLNTSSNQDEQSATISCASIYTKLSYTKPSVTLILPMNTTIKGGAIRVAESQGCGWLSS